MFNFFKRKKTASLKKFYDEVGKIAAAHGETYYAVRIEMKKETITFEGYINGFKWYSNKKSMKEVCDALKAEKQPAPVSEYSDSFYQPL